MLKQKKYSRKRLRRLIYGNSVFGMTSLSHQNCIVIRIHDILGAVICLLLLFNRSIPVDYTSLWQTYTLFSIYITTRFIREKKLKSLLYFISLWGIVESIIAILQNFSLLESNHHIFNITGTFANPAPLAGFLSICFITTINFIHENLQKQNHHLILFHIIISICILYGLILSESRAGWLSAVIGLIFLSSPKLQQNSFSLKRTIYYKAMLSFAVGIFIIIGYFLKKDSADGRLLIWLNTLNMIVDHPILGTGTGGWLANYMYYQANYFHLNPNSPFVILADNVFYSYNELLHITAEHGIIGLTLILFLLYFLLKYKSKKYEEHTMKALLITFLIFSFFSYPTQVFKLQLLFVVILGLMKSTPIKRISVSLKWSRASWLILILWTSSMAILSYRGYTQAYSQIYPKIIKKEFSNFNYSSLYELYPYFRHNLPLINLYEQNCTDDFSADKKLKLIDEIAQINPTCELYCEMGKLWMQKENYSKAKNCYKMATNMIPHRITPQYELFKLYLIQKDTISAIRIGYIILSQPLKKEGTKTLRMKGDILHFLEISNY